MDKFILDTFQEATINVLKTMASIEAIAGVAKEKSGCGTWGSVSGIIGIGGEKYSGNMILSFEESAILGVVSGMFCEEFTEMKPEVIDAVGELTNIILGSAKPILSEKGINFGMAQPMVVVGEDSQICQVQGHKLTSIPFETPRGKFVLEINVEQKA
jgi:chemotaxis protein CheX